MEIDFRDVLDYIRCPLLFYFKKAKNLNLESDLNIHDEYHSAIIKTIQYFYYKIMDGQVIIGTDEIKNRWERNFQLQNDEADRHILEDYTQPANQGNPRLRKRNKRRKLLYEGWGLLSKFHKSHYEDPGVPVAVDLDHRIKVGNIYVNGNIELARVIGEDKNKVEIVSFRTRKKLPTDFEIRHDMSITFQAMLFRDAFGEKEDILTYYLLDNDRAIQTHRSSMDLQKLDTVISNVCTSIEQEIFFPRYTFQCYYCHAQEFCAKWTGKQNTGGGN